MAEGVGFEPTVGCPTSVFKTDAIDHSATLPRFVVWGVGIRVDAMDQEKIDLFFCDQGFAMPTRSAKQQRQECHYHRIIPLE